MKSVVSECATLTSQNKGTINFISVLRSWKKLSSMALFSFGTTLTLLNIIATKAEAQLPAATEINITQQDTGTVIRTKQRRNNRQYSTLRRNNKGLEVEYLQLRLREWGYFRQNVTGIFGAFVYNTQDGPYVNAGQFPNQQQARKHLDFLRGKGFDAQLIRKSSS